MPAGSPAPAEPGAQPRSEPRRFRRARRSTLTAPILAALIGFLAGDALRPPEDQLTARAAIATIDGYRAVISPSMGKVVRCRFQPTCSAYGREAIARYGSPKGFVLTAARILRCHPWAKGGSDPVPQGSH